MADVWKVSDEARSLLFRGKVRTERIETLRNAINFKGPETETYLDSTVHLPESKRRKTAHSTSQTAFVNRIEMAKMDDRWPRQAGFLWRNLDSHRKPSHPEVTRDSRHNGQPARAVSHIILDNQRWMRASHLTSASHREINEMDFASSWEVHLTAPPFGLTR